jgi:hypothetical protein
MNDLVRAIREFLYRDLAFLLGGTLVIASIAYSLRHWLPDLLPSDLRNPPTWSLFVFSAMAFVVGYAVQDIGGVIGITFTGYVANPKWICRWLYSRFVGASWMETNVPGNDRFQFEVLIGRLDLPQPIARNLERILSLKVIGMCVGSCSLLSSSFCSADGATRRLPCQRRRTTWL